MKRLNWIILGVYIFIIIQVNKGEAMELKKEYEKFTPTFLVDNVLDDGSIVLENKDRVNLIGIKLCRSKKSISFIKKLVLGKRIVLISDRKINLKNTFYVYLLDVKINELPIKPSNSEPEARGFLDLKVGFGTKKGILYNLNTLLLKAGYASVDRSYSFEYLEYFEKCEDEAREKVKEDDNMKNGYPR
jgi:hypothetical protein